MERAVMINSRAARRVMGKHKWFQGRQIHMRPVFSRHALLGYSVIVNGAPLTENDVKALG